MSLRAVYMCDCCRTEFRDESQVLHMNTRLQHMTDIHLCCSCCNHLTLNQVIRKIKDRRQPEVQE